MELEHVIFWRANDQGNRTIRGVVVPPELRTSAPYCIEFEVPFAITPEGRLVDGELERLYDLVENIEALLGPAGGIFAGHRLGFDTLRACFYCPSAHVPNDAQLPEYQVSHDPEWRHYREHLEPTDYEYELHRARPLHEALKQSGDKERVPREVDFACVLPTAEACAAVAQAAVALGFTVIEPGELNPEYGDYWLELQRKTAVVPEVVAEHSANLRRLCREHGGEFDGWETVLMK